jgi:hypothetical protein
MASRERILQELKALGAKPKTRSRTFRIPEPVDEKIEQLSKQTGASYTDALLALVQAGLEAIAKKSDKP